MTLAAIPSPSTAVWQVGPLPIRAYALCIVLGIIAACVVTEVRLRRRGAPPWSVLDVAVWAVPFGIVGARIYHVITSPEAYFGAGGDPIRAFYIWQGGLGIWGAVAGGAVGAWLACRQMHIPLTVVADSLAPGLPLAQAIGRFGNWFNNELYGGSTTLPWGLEVHKMDPNNPGHALVENGHPVLLAGLYQPTFLYEATWDVGVALLVWFADRRFKFGRGRAFALYVMAYTAGRVWVEMLRTDQANHILGLRLNVWTSIVVFLGALTYFLRVHGVREYLVPAGDGFEVVDGERFAAYQTTGELPSPNGAAGGAADGAAGGDEPVGAAAEEAVDDAESGATVDDAESGVAVDDAESGATVDDAEPDAIAAPSDQDTPGHRQASRDAVGQPATTGEER